VQPTISIEEAGAYYGVGRSGAYDMARAGTLPLVQVTKGRRRVSVAALRRILGVDQ
jgi:excisionase family DNA binding protein